MFGKKDNRQTAFATSLPSNGSENKLSIVAEGTTVRGDFETAGNLRIDGKVLGNIISSANVAIGQGGSVEGNITAAMVKISGRVHGNLEVHGRLILDATAVLIGEVKTKLLSVEEGATFNGKVTMESGLGTETVTSVSKEYAQ
ncbi:MAG: polymer-forming cytoskeletal protein [Chloroherpetonaceae bacterium]|nr:polymer-forming cytoskeletal protein [Chloroherpetonaceae bacterium]MCS7211899.1 polymer-forming cytoskeletal protein [Chloroherpetonaceae bacterium]MDW8019662.1 polymer-forming cytoskeletal protein [Chloroherpetonaceae bacterium]MDW8465265.1 polymer-forming cytoskeletal protein [Chloroherpetonaceae bacterium]